MFVCRTWDWKQWRRDQSRSRSWRGQLGPLVGKEEVSKFEFRKGQERAPTLTSSISWSPSTPLNECSLHTRDLYNFLATIFSGGLMEIQLMSPEREKIKLR